MVEIIPSVLVETEADFLRQVRAVSKLLPMIQLDVADGEFVPNDTWADPITVEEDLEIDCELHLMVKDPLDEAQRWEGIPQVKRVLVHYESDGYIHDNLNGLHSYGWEVGVVLNPETPVDVLDDIIDEIDCVMFMGVKPGAQGQLFLSDTLGRIAAVREKYPELPIAVDGGVSEVTLPDIVEAGATRVCPGSAIFGEGDPAKNVANMRTFINTLTEE